MRSRRLVRALGAVALCLGLAATTVAAKGGSTADPATAVVAAARSHLGAGYVWGGTGPDAFDCSGLVWDVWRTTGGVATVPRVARDQFAWAVPVPLQQVLPGDLVFFGDPVTHVGIVTGRVGAQVRMVDAGASRHGVVERTVWTTGVVRFGRVPRPTMPAVAPWTPAPGPSPAASPAPGPGDPSAPAPRPGTSAVGTPPAPVTSPVPSPLPALDAPAGSAVAQRAVALARKAVGARDVGDALLVQRLWRQAGGPALPSARDRLVASGAAVTLDGARVGDLVVYAAPAGHVGLYVGNGLMVDSSRSKGLVLLRPVWGSSSLRLVRLPG